MATFNGAKFITQQIQSILDQTHANWKLYIRDDGSTDNTVSIIKQFEQKDSRIQFIADALGNLNSCQNFSVLIQSVKSDATYTMFADQDDFWMPQKIEITLKKMQQEEKLFADEPILIHTAFIYADEHLQPLKSKKNYRALKIMNLSFSHLLAQNPAYGCTMMINSFLIKQIHTIPAEAENHDYWTALAASIVGKIFFIKEPTILYRQHASNISTKHDNNKFTQRFKRIFFTKENFKDVSAKEKMAAAFNKTYRTQFSSQQKKIIDCFLNMFHKKNIFIVVKNIFNGVRRQTLLQTILFYITIIFLKKNSSVRL